MFRLDVNLKAKFCLSDKLNLRYGKFWIIWKHLKAASAKNNFQTT